MDVTIEDFTAATDPALRDHPLPSQRPRVNQNLFLDPKTHHSPYLLLHASTPNIGTRSTQAVQHGAYLANSGSDATYIFADPDVPDYVKAWEEIQKFTAPKYNVRWIEESIRADSMLDMAAFELQPPSASAKRARKKRQLFTQEDDEYLVMFHARKPEGYSRKRIEEELAAEYPQHSYNSWQERYKRGKGGPTHWDPLIKEVRDGLALQRRKDIQANLEKQGMPASEGDVEAVFNSEQIEIKKGPGRRRGYKVPSKSKRTLEEEEAGSEPDTMVAEEELDFITSPTSVDPSSTAALSFKQTAPQMSLDGTQSTPTSSQNNTISSIDRTDSGRIGENTGSTSSLHDPMLVSLARSAILRQQALAAQAQINSMHNALTSGQHQAVSTGANPAPGSSPSVNRSLSAYDISLSEGIHGRGILSSDAHIDPLLSSIPHANSPANEMEMYTHSNA